MDVSAISAYSSTISLINALSPASRVTAASSLGSILSPTGTRTSISNLGYLLNAGEALATAATALAAPGALAARKADSSDAKVATATASAATPTGTYSVQVSQLARAQTLTTGTQASSLAAIGDGQATTLSFQFASGTSRTVSLTSGDQTLAGIASAINAAGIGIQAQVSSANGGYQLSLTGQTGAANAFTLGVSGNAGIADLLAYPGGVSSALTAQAQDAQGLVNGTAFTASTNTANTAVPGLSLNLAGLGKADLTVAANAGQAKTVGAFVDAYNAVQSGLAGLGRSNPSLGLSAFFLRGQLADTLKTGEATATSLAQIGITTNANGSLALDTTKFQAALNADPNAVGRVFSNGGKGIAEQVATLTSDALSAAKLLQVAAPTLGSPANLALSVQAGLLSSLLDQGSASSDFSASLNLSNQLLLAQFSGSAGLDNGQFTDTLLDLLTRSQTISRNLSGLGIRLSVADLL